MENNQQPSDKNTSVVYIPQDAIINVEISGNFLGKCQSLLVGACTSIGNDKVKEAYEKFKDDKEPENLEEHVIFIMTSLVHAIETAAKEQSKTEVKVFTEDEINQLKNNN
jgi:hypothetical protein